MARTQSEADSSEVLQISIWNVEHFGVAPSDSDSVISIGGKSIPDSSGYSYFNGKIKPEVVDGLPVIQYLQAAYSPYLAQRKLLIQGWNPVSVIAANSTAANNLNGYAKLGADAKTTAELALKAWCIHFQDIGSDIYIPRSNVAIKKVSNGTILAQDKFMVGGYTVKWNDAIESLGNLNVISGTSQQLMPVAKEIANKVGLKTPADTQIGKAIVAIDIELIGSSKSILNYNSFDIAMNWSSWGATQDDGKPAPSFPLPPGSFILSVKSGKTNVHFRESPSMSGKIIGTLNGGDVLIENLPIDKSGWWGVTNPVNGANGFVYGEYLDPKPISYSTKKYSGSASVESGSSTGTNASAGTNTSTSTSTSTGTSTSAGTSTSTSTGTSTGTVKPDQLVPQNNAATDIDKTEEKSNTLLYVGIGVGVLAIGGIAYAILRKKA